MKQYELNDHLGNVKVVLSDQRTDGGAWEVDWYCIGFELIKDCPRLPLPSWSWTFSTDPALVYSGSQSTGVTGHAHSFILDVQQGDLVCAEVMMKFTTGTRGGYLYTVYHDANGQNEVGSAGHIYNMAAHEQVGDWSRIYCPSMLSPMANTN